MTYRRNPRKTQTLATVLGLIIAGPFSWTPASADTLKVMAAGSLRAAMTDLLQHFPRQSDEVDTPEFGSSGLMRQKTESGATADVFASADLEQPRKLAVGHPERLVVLFARNSLCALARPDLGLNETNFLDRLLDPAVRIATSTPGSDPLGSYSWEVFARADAIKPGARATLEGKAKKLVGGGEKTPPASRRARSASAVFKTFVLHPKNTFATKSAKTGSRRVGFDLKAACYAALPTRPSISLRSTAKSIGFVSSASAPPSSALRLVFASP